ncbi:unnamed protein product [Allacma fusca]|uniref:Leucine carboxyl methyltransferase 1 n=1 Tax=Allacma fusca TaxID=39272 RepID=A0A8J2JQY0_9HEXA|nr:unnamed protein product [Allacma fusca]
MSLAQGDEAVQATNDDAANCKRSAVHLGYWSDPYLSYFVRGPIVKKAPEINRGYFARTYGVYKLVLNALNTLGEIDGSLEPASVQLINLGCGFDTLYWRLNEERNKFSNRVKIKAFVDVDFPSTTLKKVHYVKNTKELLSGIANEDGDIVRSQSELHAFDYHIIGLDLRDVTQLETKLASCGIRYDVPTIFVSECVLVYLESKSSESLLSWLSQKFNTAVFINYEQINMTDNFANVMLKNLVLRGCHLSGVDHCKTIESQVNRFVETGWTGAYGWTMNEVYAAIPTSEIHRIERIEMLDEQELLRQLFDHYCITVAYKGYWKIPRPYISKLTHLLLESFLIGEF